MENDFDSLWSRMTAGEVYDATDSRLLERLAITRKALWRFNNMNPDDIEGQRTLLRQILGACGADFHFNRPFRCDYGCNIRIGERFFANFNLTILDEAPVTFGNDVFIGPNVSIYTACHPLDAEARRSRREWAEPVTIGNDVWIGGGVTVVPGVTIGDRVVVAAGAVVTKDVPSDTLVAGNPARALRSL